MILCFIEYGLIIKLRIFDWRSRGEHFNGSVWNRLVISFVDDDVRNRDRYFDTSDCSVNSETGWLVAFRYCDLLGVSLFVNKALGFDLNDYFKDLVDRGMKEDGVFSLRVCSGEDRVLILAKLNAELSSLNEWYYLGVVCNSARDLG